MRRGRNQQSKGTSDGSDCIVETDGKISQAAADGVDQEDASVSSKVRESEPDVIVSSSSDQIKWLAQQASFEVRI